MKVIRYVHCKGCMLRGQTQRLEVALDGEGLTVACKKHGLVVQFTPASLAAKLEHPPECECCKVERGLS